MNTKKYIKIIQEEFAPKIERLENLLPYYTEHLNNLHGQLQQIQCLIQSFKKDGSADSDTLKNFEELEHNLTFNSFLTICTLDLIVICKNTFQSKHFWEEIFNLRQSYLIIYEALKTYQIHYPKINFLLLEYYHSNDPQFKKLNHDIRKFKKEYAYDKVIGSIRNTTAGHIDPNFILYFSKISSFNIEKATKATYAFVELLIKMQSLSREIAISTLNSTPKISSTLDIMINYYLADTHELFKKLEKGLSDQ